MLSSLGTMEIVLLLLIAASCAYGLFSLICIIDFFSSKKSSSSHIPSAPVSVLKPLKGADPDLGENLLSFCRQAYPEFEVLLGFNDRNDSAVPTANKTIKAVKECRSRIVVARRGIGVNRKVSNLQGMLEAAHYPLLAMSDSDMRADGNYLRTIIGEYHQEAGVGLVTSLYKISSPETMGAAFESLTIALDFIPSVLVARRLEGITFGLGASMLISKKALEDIGGFPAIADYLADDYQIGNRLWRKGYKIVLSRYVLEDIAGRMSMADYFAHQLRWARTYRACRPKGFLGYGITHALPLALLFFLLHGPAALSFSVLSAVIIMRLGLFLALYKKVIRTKKWLLWLPLMLLKDITSFGIWLWSFLGSKVSWRGRVYRVEKGGRILPDN